MLEVLVLFMSKSIFFVIFSFFLQYPALFLGETKISDDKRQELKKTFGFAETFLEGRKWFCGDNLTIADLSILASMSSAIVSDCDGIFFTFLELLHLRHIYFQHMGASLTDYPNLKRWYEQCASNVKGFAENDKGAKVFGEKVRSMLTDQL